MKDFRTVAYDPARVRKELAEFDKLLKSRPILSERKDLLPSSENESSCRPSWGPTRSTSARGRISPTSFRSWATLPRTLSSGNRAQGEYLVIELEDATPASVFTKVRGKSTKEWSRRFDHGYSQLIDWFSCLDDYRKTNKFIDEFGHGHVTFYGLLIVGRNAGMTDGDRMRLRWRSSKVVVNSQPITCITFDDLHEALQRRLILYTKGAKLEKD